MVSGEGKSKGEPRSKYEITTGGDILGSKIPFCEIKEEKNSKSELSTFNIRLPLKEDFTTIAAEEVLNSLLESFAVRLLLRKKENKSSKKASSLLDAVAWGSRAAKPSP